MHPIWEAFEILSASRQMGFSVGPIPLSEIRAYLEIFQISDPEYFISCIRAMDRVFMDHYNKKLTDGSKPEIQS